MTKTIIQVDTKTRDLLKSFGNMGETYDDVIRRIYSQALENMLAKGLMDTKGCITIEEAMEKYNVNG